MSKISIIIRCYNEEEHIGRLLSGITPQTVKDVEIILVDSGSTDATLSIYDYPF
ncbi:MULTISPECIES: glycosyltransferase [unclassified Methanosarcina]|uniref:glycosyltransferase family 2 protein n=1 Tax=unclassified Methanosarcina TaxID=2644672 RepID=UPI000AC69026|nr:MULTISPECIES: glycosyltransferase [unclassified Methanosarcina]